MNTSKQNQPSELKPSVVGVDLGAFSVKIAAVEKGVVDIITNQANLRQTPSIVGYGSKERLIGESGNVKLKSNLANTIISPQRYLSLQTEEQLSHETKFLPCKIRREEIENKFKVNCQGKQEMITPEQATAALFTKIQQIIELNQIGSKVITVAVPSDFTYQQKQALLDSLQISRKASKNNFSLQIVSESTAVGLDYGYYKKHEFSEKEEEAKNVMFLDFGHSKLSLYIIKFTRNYQKVLYQKHLNQLGCRDLDEIVLQFYSQLFEKQNPSLEVSVKESKKATFKLLQAIQRQRKVLTGISEYDFNIDCLLEECDISYTMKRQELESIISPALETIQNFFSEVLNDLKEKSINFTSIQLIGGGSRIPIFIKMVSNIFGVDPSRTLNSSQCVAKGTALHSAMNSGIFRMQPYYSIDLSPEKVNINWKANPEEFLDQSNEVVLINEGDHIYSKKSIDFSVNTEKSNQFHFTLSNGHKRDICSFSIELACENQQTPQKTLRLTAFFGSNGTIDKIDIREVKETIQSQIQVRNFSLFQHIHPQQLKEFIKIQTDQIKKDQQIISFYERKNSFESQIYDLKQKASGFLGINEIKDYINHNDHSLLMNQFENIQNNLEQIVQFDNILKEVKEKMSIFYSSIQETKKSYQLVDSQLQKFSQLIDSVISGKIKKIKYYPKQESEEALQWIKQIKSLQKTKPKYERHPTSLEEINQKIESFKSSVDRVQEEMSMKQKQNNQRYYQPERTSEPTRFNNNHSSYNPFGTTDQSRQYDPRYRRGRNQSFNGYNSGLFSGFSGFF